MRFIIIPVILLHIGPDVNSQSPGRARDLGIEIGVFKTDRLNDIQGMHIRKEHVIRAFQNAAGGRVTEGNVGAATGKTGHNGYGKNWRDRF